MISIYNSFDIGEYVCFCRDGFNCIRFKVAKIEVVKDSEHNTQVWYSSENGGFRISGDEPTLSKDASTAFFKWDQAQAAAQAAAAVEAAAEVRVIDPIAERDEVAA